MFENDPRYYNLPNCYLEENNRKIAVIFAHGFGDESYNIDFDTTLKNQATAISFNFDDTHLFYGNSLFQKLKGLRAINLGQIHDAQYILYALIESYDAGFEKIVGFGHSRGAAAWITTLDMLSNPLKYKNLWEKFNIIDDRNSLDLKKIEKIKSKVIAGKIFLCNPLLHIAHAIAQKNLFAKIFIHLILRLSRYDSTHNEPINILDTIIIILLI